MSFEEFTQKIKDKVIEFEPEGGWSDFEFCCDYHKDKARELRRKAIRFVGGDESVEFRTSDGQYFLDIIRGNAFHPRAVEVRCVHKDWTHNPVDPTVLKDMTIPQLRKLANEHFEDLEIPSKAKKPEVIKLIRRNIKTTAVQCENMLTGSPKEIGARGTKCDEHRKQEEEV